MKADLPEGFLPHDGGPNPVDDRCRVVTITRSGDIRHWARASAVVWVYGSPIWEASGMPMPKEAEIIGYMTEPPLAATKLWSNLIEAHEGAYLSTPGPIGSRSRTKVADQVAAFVIAVAFAEREAAKDAEIALIIGQRGRLIDRIDERDATIAALRAEVAELVGALTDAIADICASEGGAPPSILSDAVEDYQAIIAKHGASNVA